MQLNGRPARSWAGQRRRNARPASALCRPPNHRADTSIGASGQRGDRGRRLPAPGSPQPGLRVGGAALTGRPPGLPALPDRRLPRLHGPGRPPAPRRRNTPVDRRWPSRSDGAATLDGGGAGPYPRAPPTRHHALAGVGRLAERSLSWQGAGLDAPPNLLTPSGAAPRLLIDVLRTRTRHTAPVPQRAGVVDGHADAALIRHAALLG
jgi:hypothetical protein